MSKPRRYLALYRRITGQQGFTLMELLVAMVIMIVVLIAIYTIWFGLQRTYSFTDDDLVAQRQAQTALSEIVESVRTSRLPTSAPTSYLRAVIVYADSNNLVCWTDIDRDTDSLHLLELVRYRLEGRVLWRDDYGRTPHFHNYSDLDAVTSQPVRLVGNWVSNGADHRSEGSDPSLFSDQRLFVYCDGGGTELNVLDAPVPDVTLIRTVIINLLIDVKTDLAPIAHQLRSVVQPRNLRQY